MVIHIFLLRVSSLVLGKGRGGDHDQTALCEEVILRSWEKDLVIMAIGLFSPLLGREGLVVMVTHLFLLRISSSLLGKGRGGGHGQTLPSADKLSCFPWIG